MIDLKNIYKKYRFTIDSQIQIKLTQYKFLQHKVNSNIASVQHKMQTIRNRLNDLSLQTKQKVFSLYILTLFAIVMSTVIYIGLSMKHTIPIQPYANYVKEYAKQYSSIQQTYRRFIFYQTYNDIIFHNKKQLDENYIKGLNQFSDLTKQEFQQLYHIVTTVATQKQFIQIADFAYDTFDWSEKYLPSVVKNMKDYDVGHIFATIGLIQFQINKKRQPNDPWITLSQQQIIDCCPDCGVGEQPHKVFKHVIQNGISPDENYPYTSAIYNQEKQECKTKNQLKPYKPVVGFERIKTCQQLSNAVEKGPVVVGVDATQLKQYAGGIASECSDKRSHYMLLVGKGIGYWKLKNNWGVRWGERGYIRIKLGNTCAICMHGYNAIFSQSV